jgi:hypothetical protein
MIAPEMASSAVRFFERMMEEKKSACTGLASIGLSPDQVRKLTAGARPVGIPTPQEARREIARMARLKPQRGWGRRGMPAYVAKAMFQEYKEGKSLAQVAKIFGCSRQALFEVFQRRGFVLRGRAFQSKIDFKGVSYTFSKGYFRGTNGTRRRLHHVMWEDAHGPIPKGCSIGFRDGDSRNTRIDNLICLNVPELSRYHHRRKQNLGGKAA